jgi:2-keto-4-pentenoate hydratase
MSTSPLEHEIAAALVTARRAGRSLPGFPGPVPPDMAAAYRIQDAAMALWPDEPIGWKIGYIAPDRRRTGEPDRLVGPIWRAGCRPSGAAPAPVGIFGSGFAAVEAEFVVRLREDVPAPRGGRWTADDVAGVAYDLLVGVEVASSPVPAINDLGPTVVAADFGNNNGLVLGPSVSAGDGAADPRLRCFVDGDLMGQRSLGDLPGGLHHALATAWSVLASRGHPIRAGLLFATGAITGIHDVVPGQVARVEVDGGPAIEVRTVDVCDGQISDEPGR